MLEHKLFRKIFDYIENKRGDSNFFWSVCINLKDLFWKVYTLIMYSIQKHTKVPQFKKFKNADKYYKVSFCITSMNRLCHIKKTLIKNLKHNMSYPGVEFVLLDYNSKDGLKEWVDKNCKEYIESGILKYYRTDEPQYFHMAHAKNMAHNLASGDILCGLDADNFTNKDFAFFINFHFSKNKNAIGCISWENKNSKLDDFGGRICISKEDFIKLNGYDENFTGWGYEDLDFKHRALEEGMKRITIHPFFLRCIRHSDALRDKHMPISKQESIKINKELFESKRELAKLRKEKELIPNKGV